MELNVPLKTNNPHIFEIVTILHGSKLAFSVCLMLFNKNNKNNNHLLVTAISPQDIRVRLQKYILWLTLSRIWSAFWMCMADRSCSVSWLVWMGRANGRHCAGPCIEDRSNPSQWCPGGKTLAQASADQRPFSAKKEEMIRSLKITTNGSQKSKAFLILKNCVSDFHILMGYFYSFLVLSVLSVGFKAILLMCSYKFEYCTFQQTNLKEGFINVMQSELAFRSVF